IESSLFLDFSGAVSAGPEGGLPGLAFAPDFVGSGRLLVSFTDRSGNLVVSRLQRTGADALRADPDSRFDLRWPSGDRFITFPLARNYGGHLAFGGDGYLYLSVGDGGTATTSSPGAQHPGVLLGKMLRIDVNVGASDDRGYRIPPDNPFVNHSGVLPEIWAFGLRDPRRWTFDDPRLGG